MTTFRELLQRLGTLRTVEPVTDYAYTVMLQKRLEEEEVAPHGRPWHTSFHASSFPGEEPQCPRAALYGMLDIPDSDPISRWLNSVAEAGKTFELGVVRANREAGFLCRSNQPGRSSDPDAVDADGSPMPQMGFVDKEAWLTGSVDMPLKPWGYSSPHIVEIKSKHESQIREMQAGERSYDEKHRKQAMCSLGLANSNPDAFLDPVEDVVLEPARDCTVYYGSRDTKWPGPVETFEFYFEHDPTFFEAGRSQLISFKEAFIEGELVTKIPRKNTRSHPLGWRWSEGQCKHCPFKKLCRADYDGGVNKIMESNTIDFAKSIKPNYDAAAKRAAVFSQWDEEDPLLP